MSAQRILVSGRVHGVGYRDWTVRTAHRLGLTGWVRNLSDGRVEILAKGDDEALGALVEACNSGPPLARVEHVATLPGDGDAGKGFTKRLTAQA